MTGLDVFGGQRNGQSRLCFLGLRLGRFQCCGMLPDPI